MESVNEIESRIININSSNASQKNNTTYNSDVVFKFPGLVKRNQPYIKKVQFQLLDACIPVSFYNINYTNNILIYQISSINYTIAAQVGNYNFNSLAVELTSKFLLNGHTFTVSINKLNGIIKFTSTVNFILISSGSTMFNILGLIISNHASSSFIINCDYPLNLLGITKIKISSINLNSYNLDSSNNGNSNLIACIPVDQPSFGLIIYENKSFNKFTLRGDVVDEIDIQLTDQNDNLINFNNIDFQLTLLLEFTIEKPLNNSDQVNDILKNQNKILSNLINITPTQTPDQPPDQTPINPVSTDDLEFFIYSNPNKEIKV
jgi:hypothetical protein